jgi:hypothetical protein
MNDLWGNYPIPKPIDPFHFASDKQSRYRIFLFFHGLRMQNQIKNQNTLPPSILIYYDFNIF